MDRLLEAKIIDSHHLRLKEPVEITPGSTVLVTIKPAEGIAEDQGWYVLASHGLEAAYGEDEPDYPLERIKIPNPEYQP